jgi:hypothetical protein
MACYIASNANRFYVTLESDFGSVANVASLNRVPAIGLGIRRETELPPRRDKTGLRTYVGHPSGFRSRTQFEFETLLAEWDTTNPEPAYGPMFQAALGSTPASFPGGTVQEMTTPTMVTFSGPHGLAVDQAVECKGELRFVSAIVDASTVLLNAPFKAPAEAGTSLGATITYMPATELPSVSIYDYWDPVDAVQRILVGCGVDKMRIDINGDYHYFGFSGIARELIDNATHSTGQAGLTDFPQEPEVVSLSQSVVPGNLGQAWFGDGPSQFSSVLSAEVVLSNNLESRTREFGSDSMHCLVPGAREVNMSFRLYSNTEPETTALYQAARQRSPIPVMLQLGQGSGQLCGVYMKSVVPAVPEFDDTDRRLQWKFGHSRAQGASNDELVIAFG